MAIGSGSGSETFHHDGDIDMSLLLQDPGCPEEGQEKEGIFTIFNSPDGRAAEEIPGNDFVTFNQDLGDDKNTGDHSHSFNEAIKKSIEFFHRPYPFWLKNGSDCIHPMGSCSLT